LLAYLIVAGILAWVVWTDWKEGIIPNRAVLAVLVCGVYRNWGNWLEMALGFFICFGIFYTFYSSGGIGGGDVKLAGALGVFGGFGGVYILAFTLLAAVLYVAGAKARKGELRAFFGKFPFVAKLCAAGHLVEYVRNLPEEHRETLPLGCFFLPGFLIYLLLSYLGVV